MLSDWNAGTGSTTTGLSGAYIDSGSTFATTAKSLRMERIVPRDDNAYGAYVKVECSFAEHALLTGAAGTSGI